MTPHSILLDVGGTFIKCSDGRSVPVDSAGTAAEIRASLREAVGDATEVAVAIPGPFDYSEGIFLMKHKFASVYGRSFAELIDGVSAAGGPTAALRPTAAGGISGQPSHGHRTYRFIHDVNCMLLGGLADPEVAGFGRVALVTLGTGLGFAVSIDGQLQCNAAGSPAIPMYNRPYRDGIAEDYVSKRGIMRTWCGITGREWPEGQTVKDIALTPEGRETFARTGEYLAEIAAPLLGELGIECLLLGGQISKSFSLFGDTLRSGLASVPSLRHIAPLKDLDTATFTGLRSL